MRFEWRTGDGAGKSKWLGRMGIGWLPKGRPRPCWYAPIAYLMHAFCLMIRCEVDPATGCARSSWPISCLDGSMVSKLWGGNFGARQYQGSSGRQMHAAKPLDTESPHLTKEDRFLSYFLFCFCSRPNPATLASLLPVDVFQVICSGNVQRESSGLLVSASSSVIVTVFETIFGTISDSTGLPSLWFRLVPLGPGLSVPRFPAPWAEPRE